MISYTIPGEDKKYAIPLPKQPLEKIVILYIKNGLRRRKEYIRRRRMVKGWRPVFLEQ